MSELSDIKELLQELSQRQAVHAAEQRELKEDIGQIKHVLIEGNGTPPMTVRLAIAEHELERLKEERNDKKMPRAAWVAIALSTFLSAVGIAAALV